jgi:hypothetical protein
MVEKKIMNEVDFRNKMGTTADNLRSNAEAAASEAMRAAGMAGMAQQEIDEGHLLEATELLEQAREALIESGQHMMFGLKGTRLEAGQPVTADRRRLHD